MVKSALVPCFWPGASRGHFLMDAIRKSSTPGSQKMIATWPERRRPQKKFNATYTIIYILYNYITYKKLYCIGLYLRIFAYTCTIMYISRCITWRIWCTLRSLQATPIFDQVVDPETGKVTFTAPGGLEFSRVAMFLHVFPNVWRVSPFFAIVRGASPFFPIFWRQFLPLFSQFLGECLNFVHHFWVSFSFFSQFVGEFLQFFQFFGGVFPVFQFFLEKTFIRESHDDRHDDLGFPFLRVLGGSK